MKTHNNPGVEPDFVIGDLTSVPYVRPKESRRRERDPYSRPTLASETGPSNLLAERLAELLKPDGLERIQCYQNLDTPLPKIALVTPRFSLTDRDGSRAMRKSEIALLENFETSSLNDLNRFSRASHSSCSLQISLEQSTITKATK